MADEKITQPRLADVVAQDAKVVGDDEVQAEVHSVEPEVVSESVAAQVAQPREADSDSVNVHEVSVVTDRVILDPSDPLAVQVPDAGRGSLDLPIHALDAPTVEEVFSSEASEADTPEDPQPGDVTDNSNPDE
jgi:hypothetical protein